MDDRDVVARISHLADEEHRLERAHVGVALSPEEQDQLRSLQVQLDQCWDLLAQRRARRDSGQDPDAAQVRPEAVVEHFQQ
ncbi:MAG: hypothetical protein JWM85_126 [Acidimicrobiaceae bacterium]|nr:hypothetical protein [Acidimicrobiaceae bacterium]